MDILSIVVTLFGVCTSLGLGVRQACRVNASHYARDADTNASHETKADVVFRFDFATTCTFTHATATTTTTHHTNTQYTRMYVLVDLQGARAAGRGFLPR